jgi:anhydro-N-acetylmuramic acid kinase
MSASPHHLPLLGAAVRRVLIGVAIPRRADSLASAVRLAVEGRGLELRGEVLASATRPPPRDLGQLLEATTRGEGTSQDVARLGGGLAQFAAMLTHEVATSAELAETLALGVRDPGLWLYDTVPPQHWSLCDAAQLADATGLTVVDAFESRDLAQGGQGGPLTALPQWMLLHDAKKPRVLVDLGRSTRLTYLPASYEGSGAGRVMAMEVGPGTRLLDRFAAELTDGQTTIDHGGRYAVQGRQIAPLIEHWLACPELAEGQMRWRPEGVEIDWFFDEAIRLAVESNWSMCDLLCSANGLIAELIARTIVARVPKAPPLGELVVTGGGKKNGLLLREIARRLPELPLVHATALGVRPELMDASCTALLALLHLLQTSATSTLITGAAAPRVLGRLTPGNPQNWQHVVRDLAANRPAVMSLRSAI